MSFKSWLMILSYQKKKNTIEGTILGLRPLGVPIQTFLIQRFHLFSQHGQPTDCIKVQSYELPNFEVSINIRRNSNCTIVYIYGTIKKRSECVSFGQAAKVIGNDQVVKSREHLSISI